MIKKIAVLNNITISYYFTELYRMADQEENAENAVEHGAELLMFLKNTPTEPVHSDRADEDGPDQGHSEDASLQSRLTTLEKEVVELNINLAKLNGQLQDLEKTLHEVVKSTRLHMQITNETCKKVITE